VISGVATFGFWAETVEHKCEGMVSLTELTEFDDFEYNERRICAGRSQHRRKRFAMGDEVKRTRTIYQPE
jgi:ribonuclease R